MCKLSTNQKHSKTLIWKTTIHQACIMDQRWTVNHPQRKISRASYVISGDSSNATYKCYMIAFLIKSQRIIMKNLFQKTFKQIISETFRRYIGKNTWNFKNFRLWGVNFILPLIWSSISLLSSKLDFIVIINIIMNCPSCQLSNCQK